MPHKSWKARALRSQQAPAPKRITATVWNSQIVQDRIAADKRMELQDQAIIRERLMQHYRGDMPVPVLYALRAMRLGSVC